MPVPSAITAKPSQIQLTSGLIVISRLAVWSATWKLCMFRYRSPSNFRRMATSVVGSSCLLKNHRAGYIFAISRPPSNTVKCPVIICFWLSFVTFNASIRTT